MRPSKTTTSRASKSPPPSPSPMTTCAPSPSPRSSRTVSYTHLGIVLPLGAIFQSIYRKSGNAGFKVGIGLVAQFGASGTVEQRHLHDRTNDQNSLLRNTDRHHHVVEHLYQNAHGIGKCCGARQAGRPRKASRKVCVGSRSAVAQRCLLYTSDAQGKTQMVTKGAAEEMLEICSYVEVDGTAKPLTRCV